MTSEKQSGKARFVETTSRIPLLLLDQNGQRSSYEAVASRQQKARNDDKVQLSIDQAIGAYVCESVLSLSNNMHLMIKMCLVDT